MTLQEADWQGLITGGRATESQWRVQAILPQLAPEGGSHPLLVQGTDGVVTRRFWVKPLRNGQGSERVPITEQIVGRVGALVGAPVCEVVLLEVPAELDGEPTGRPSRLTVGFEHGSGDIADAQLVRDLVHRTEDDNASRQAWLFALFDWCWGDDQQWLYDAGDQNRIYSHDHGFYLPPGGTTWTVETLRASVDTPHVLGLPIDGLQRGEFTAAADKFEAVTRDELVQVLRQIPESWPVSDAELETLGWFLERRIAGVAQRLRALGAI